MSVDQEGFAHLLNGALNAWSAWVVQTDDKDHVRRINGTLNLWLGPSWHLEPYILYLALVSAALMISAAKSMGAPIQLTDFDFELGLDEKGIGELLESDGLIESISIE